VTGSSVSLYPLGDDYEVTNGVVTKYVSVEGLGVVAKRVGAAPSITTFWLHTDRLGSIQAITGVTGAEVQRRTYRPYGDKIADTTGHVESRGYIEERQDGETGLTYLHARYYDPAVGIFLSPDPIGPDGGANEYGYALANPVNGRDPAGLYWCGPPDNPTSKWCEEVTVPGDSPGAFPGIIPGLAGIGGDADGAYERMLERIQQQRERAKQRQQQQKQPQEPPQQPVCPESVGECGNGGDGGEGTDGGDGGDKKDPSKKQDAARPNSTLLSKAINFFFPNRTCSGSGYSDLNVNLGAKGFVTTGGAEFAPGGGVYPYLGGGIGTPGIAGTTSPNQPSPGFNVGLQVTFMPPLSVQVGYGAFGRNGSRFVEYGGGTPGFALTGFWVFDCQ